MGMFCELQHVGTQGRGYKPEAQVLSCAYYGLNKKECRRSHAKAQSRKVLLPGPIGTLGPLRLCVRSFPIR